ncbi:MAG TPA: hypothetical protein VIJ10_02405 [Vicinamibacteria bacterium]|jgi:hypothetical protein
MRFNGSWVLAGLVAFAAASPSQAATLRFSGFGDVVFGVTQGSYASADERAQFEQFGVDPDPVNTMRGFQITGTDFVVIADMNEKLTFLGEVNLQAGRGVSNEIELDVERFFVDYKIDERFNLQAGLFFTPIGYNNRFLYARAWLMNSIQVPDFFEEELNLIPTHSVGVAAYGGFALGGERTLNWTVSVGNGRSRVPDQTVYARDFSSNKEVTGLVELIIPGFKDSRVGVSGWLGKIDSVRVDSPSDPGVDLTGGEAMELRESGLDVYAVVHTRHFSLNAEWVFSWQEDQLGNLPDSDYSMNGGLVEASLHLHGGKLHPYLRYDRTSFDQGGGPFLSLREDGGVVTRHYVPVFESVMTGAAYDINAHARVKAEYQHHLDGPRKDGVAFQIAYGF